MALTSILALALLATASHAYIGSPFGGPAAMGRHPMMGPGGHPLLEEHPEPRFLTCLVRFRNPSPPNNVLNAIAVNIQERKPDHPAPGQGGFMGSFLNPLMGGQQQKQGPGLEAYIQLFSTTGGPVSVAVTDAARPEESCNAEDFGYFLRHPNSQRGIGGGFPMFPGVKYGMGGYGAMGGMKYGMGAMKYGMMGNPMMAKKMMMMKGPMNPMMMGGYYGSMMGMHPHMHPGMDLDDDFKPEGVIAETDLAPNMKATINIDRLEGFTRLEDLAGRGIVVCPDAFVERHGDDATCEGGILACCALHFDERKQMLA